MTVTLKPWAVILLVAAIGVLIGLAAGQLTQAESRTVNQVVKQQKLLVKEQKRANALLELMEDQSYKNAQNTYEICREQGLSKSGCQKPRFRARP